MLALIFGGGGQDGVYLSDLLRKNQISFICLPHRLLDVSDFHAVKRIISKYHPDYIFNFAAASTTRHDALFENHAAISTGTLNILESVKRHCPTARVFITGSGVQFKNHGPIDENAKFEATSPYSVARIQSVYAARYYRSLGIKAYVGYLFHHESHLRPSGHVSRMIVDAAKRITRGSDEKLVLGDISVVKEWAFAGDIVKAIWTLVNQDAVTEAVIGTGDGHSIQEWIEACFGIMDWRNHIILKDDFSAEYKCLISNPLVIKSLGWKPEVNFYHLSWMMVTNKNVFIR